MDISLLQSLTYLEGLFLKLNQITDIGPLQGLTDLTLLDLSHNGIVDISPVQYLVNLDAIDLSFNIGVIDAEPLWICHLAGGLQAGADVYVNSTGLIPGDPWLALLTAAGVNVVF
jgi:Leucine-rich repeat (LRR) protein